MKQKLNWNNIKRRAVYTYIVSINRITKPRKNPMNKPNNVNKKANNKVKSTAKKPKIWIIKIIKGNK